ncbi:uncharacterized protein LOC110383166 [Helicoverpa armigera]|uniref:uncharacterized protein LOC110383166 n=1 Tax=Helicoverpa armigera TaxID=29058 RepID=UPI0030839486
MVHYEELKPKTNMDVSRKGKSMKKMGMAMMPLVFHVGATSTWMLLTSIMAVKSVIIGLVLLVFKIAVSSAKVASFFTSLKSKYSHHDHSPEHHGYERSLPDTVYHAVDWSSYSPEFSHASPYKTIPMYKSNDAIEHEDINEESKSHS